MTYKIGITGGMGSGKTTVGNVFKLFNIPVFVADIESKKLVNSNKNIQEGLKEMFGSDIYLSENQIDKLKLAHLIFNNESLLQKVNSLIHPEVEKYFLQWVEQQNTKYIIHDAAILFETGFYKMMDYNILVSAPVEIRKKRVLKRDKISKQEFYDRVEKQWSDDQKRALADAEIVNDGRKMIIPQVIDIYKRLEKLVDNK